ncbi:MMPL family transporter [Longispora albida]|uniref:MMPL family transporter n=1 Tax=Longispora albida TaxID=203523 RepID=UPI00036DD9AB|nr:MMPL family transporter [Longispora albida]
MFAAIGRGVTRRPWLVIAGWLLAALAIMAAAPSLKSVTNSDQSAFLPSTTESAKATEVARAAGFTKGATAVIHLQRADGGTLTPADLGQVGQLAQKLNQDKPDAVVGALFDPKQLVAPNGKGALIAVQFEGAAREPRVHDAVDKIRSQLDVPGLKAGMTGEAAIDVDNTKAMADAEKIVTIATLGLIVVLLLLIFRSPIAAVLPLVSVGLVYGISQALVAISAKLFSFEIGTEVQTLLTVVLFGIGTDYILFLLFRYRERLRAGDSPREAIVAAVDRVGEAISSAALAVIAAFGALVLALLGFFTTLGPALAIGVFVMLLAALTLVPAIISVLGPRIFWPVRTEPDTAGHPAFARLGRFVARRPLAAVLGSLAFLIGLSAGVFGYQATYDPLAQLPAKMEATTAFKDLGKNFPAGVMSPSQAYLKSDTPLTPEQVQAFALRVGGHPAVATPMQPQLSADGKVAQVPLILKEAPYSAKALDAVEGLRDAAHEAAPAGTTAYLGGMTSGFADIRDITNRDLSVIFPVAGLLFLLILGGLLRAAVAPLYLVGMVVLGFAATLGAAVFLFQGALGNAGLMFMLPIIMYLFVTAIGTDYNILITARIREELREGRDAREAAELAVEHAGPSIAAAAVILAGTFGSLLISGVSFFAQMGFAVTLGIALVAFVVSLVLVPAATVLLSRSSWWPGLRQAKSPAPSTQESVTV